MMLYIFYIYVSIELQPKEHFHIYSIIMAVKIKQKYYLSVQRFLYSSQTMTVWGSQFSANSQQNTF